jgi:hypothetical protein
MVPPFLFTHMGSISRENQSERFMRAFRELILEDYKDLIGKKLVIEDIDLVYDEMNSEVKVEFTLQGENDKYKTTYQEEGGLFFADCTTEEDVKSTYGHEIENDPDWKAAFDIYRSWNDQLPNVYDLPQVNRTNAISIRDRLCEVNLLAKE